MADSAVLVSLDKGLDTTTSPLMTEPGSLVACHNYEMVSDVGYRRIDGYERYDGWTGGGISDYYTVSVNNTAAITPVPGDTIVLAGDDNYVLGTVINYASSTLVYAPANKDLPIFTAGTELAIYPATTSQLTVLSGSIKGSVNDDLDTFVSNIRTYGTTLRALVQDVPTPVAGLHWMRDNLIVAHDCYTCTFVADAPGVDAESVNVGQLFKAGDYTYRIIESDLDGGFYTVSLQRLEEDGPFGIGNEAYTQRRGDPFGFTYAWEPITVGDVTINTNNDLATFSMYHTPVTAYERELEPILGTFTLGFENGSTAFAGSSFEPLQELKMQIGVGGTDNYNGRIISTRVDSGDFATGDAVGYVEIEIPINSIFVDWPEMFPKVGEQGIALGDSFPSAQPMFTITSVHLGGMGAGTAELRRYNTRYLGATYNFFGREDWNESYIVNGASMASWVRLHPVNLIRTTVPFTDGISTAGSYPVNIAGWLYTDDSFPKYVSIHKGVRLALGHAKGSVFMSAVGEPHNYSGFQGAVEIATGDAVTGLVEASGDALIVFGRRGIRRITGTVEADMALSTISGNAGCFDYTANLIGSTPIFVGPSGISTLDQTAAYGDFLGSRISYNINTTFLDEIVPDRVNSELGGVAMAMPVRSKNAYRLWLGTGKVISVTLTSKGPKLTYLNYGQTDDNRVPFAWSSQLADSGQEMIHVVWDTERAEKYFSATGTVSTVPEGDRVYQLNRGWGFDGETFNHSFDITHVFPSNGTQSTSVYRVRLYGLSHGLASLNVKSSGIEDDFDQDYHSQIQDISLPVDTAEYRSSMEPMTSVVDQANWGLGIKLQFQNSVEEGLTTTEPPHVCQNLILYVRDEGAGDN